MTGKIDTADVVIVGAGPSGAVAAHTLAQAGLRVVCLEQGDWQSPADYPGNRPEYELLLQKQWNWNPNTRGRPADYPMNLDQADVTPIMFGGVGGSSLLYGAMWMRLMPSDFRVKSLDGICDDWPIDYWDLEPFYTRIDKFIGVSGMGGDPAYPQALDYDMPPYPLGRGGMRMAEAINRLGWHWWVGANAIPTARHKAMEKCLRWGVCETGCPAGAKASFDLAYWPHATAAGARLITGARVCEITTDAAGRADGVVWIDRKGSRHRQQAGVVILAANGVGTPRLLLMSQSAAHPQGLANRSGLVGRNLMLHPNNEVLGLYDEPLQSWTGPAGQLMYSMQFYETDLARGFYRGSKLNLMPVPGILRFLDDFNHLPFERRWGAGIHDLAKYAGRAMTWAGNIEDLPEAHNRVTLDDRLADSDGLPAPKINYRICDNTQKSLDFSRARMVDMHREGGGRLIRTSLHLDSEAAPYPAQRVRHSARAAARLALKSGLLERLRTWLKWFVTDAWTAANFCKLRIRRKRSIARSRRRKGRCEFSARLLSQQPVTCRPVAPISRRAAP